MLLRNVVLNIFETTKNVNTVGNAPNVMPGFKGTYGSVMGSRNSHWRTKHSEFPITDIRRSAPTVVAVAYGLPENQTAWTCPLCPA